MYLVLLILRELRRLFNNKTFKLGFTIAILTFAILNLIALLPSSGVFASTRYNLFFSQALCYVGTNTFTGSISTYRGNTLIDANEYYYITAFEHLGTQSPTRNDDNKTLIYYCAVNGGDMVHINSGHSGGTLVLFTNQPLNDNVGVNYISRIDLGSYDIYAPGDGYMIFYALGVHDFVSGLYTGYIDIEDYATSEDIGETTNTITNTTKETQNTIKQESQETQNTITQESQETRNTITDTNIDNTITDILPQSTFVNPYEGNVDNIFTKIYNNFTDPNFASVILVVPFTNKRIIISNSTVYGSWNATWLTATLKNLINLFWYYIFGRFIILDVLTIIEKIKNGKIDKIVDSNVKEDML